MIIGVLQRTLREQKNLSQGQIEERSGLLRCYISRVENGHTVPSIETLEKMSRALEVPVYQLFFEGNGTPAPPKAVRKAPSWGSAGKDARLLKTFCNLFSRTEESDRKLLLHLARKMADNRAARRLVRKSSQQRGAFGWRVVSASGRSARSRISVVCLLTHPFVCVIGNSTSILSRHDILSLVA